ncbi:MAG: hypothetical protein LHW51_10195 [Candidatus Cloacimonetes bacterium]|nr:hypothetical protein [Candidatus Cloacimonadota bacterium]
MIDDTHYGKVMAKNGIFSPTIMLNGPKRLPISLNPRLNDWSYSMRCGSITSGFY